VTPLRNEVDETGQTDHAAKAPMGFAVTLIAGLHILCCGLLLPLLAGVSLATVLPSAPALGVIAALLGSVSFVWYVRKSRATCSGAQKCRLKQGPEDIG